MKKFSNIKVVRVFAWFGLIMTLNTLGDSYINYQLIDNSLETVKSFSPLERDIPSEIVKPLVVGRKDADSILYLVHRRYEESHMLHELWFNSVERHRKEALFEIFYRAGLLMTFVIIIFFEKRSHREL